MQISFYELFSENEARDSERIMEMAASSASRSLPCPVELSLNRDNTPL